MGAGQGAPSTNQNTVNTVEGPITYAIWQVMGTLGTLHQDPAAQFYYNTAIDAYNHKLLTAGYLNSIEVFTPGGSTQRFIAAVRNDARTAPRPRRLSRSCWPSVWRSSWAAAYTGKNRNRRTAANRRALLPGFHGALARRAAPLYRQDVTITRRSVLTALSAAAAAQAQRQRAPNWKPKLGVLCQYSEANLDFVKAEGFTSMQLRLDPNRLDDAAIASIKDRIQKSGIHVSSLAVDGNHIDPDPAARERQNQYTIKCLELCGKLGIPNIGGQSGTIKGRPLQEQVDEIVRVYSEKYFPLCEKYKVRILWEPYAGGPNIGTGPIGWEALFKSFKDSPHVGLQFDPSHLVWQFMDPVAAAREFADKIYDVHLKDTEILWHVLRRTGINPLNNARWWRFRIPGQGSVDWKGFFSVLSDAGYTGAMNIENEDEFYYPAYNQGNFTDQYKRGFRLAHEFLKTMVPPVAG